MQVNHRNVGRLVACGKYGKTYYRQQKKTEEFLSHYQ
jgi:hypothetical protein